MQMRRGWLGWVATCGLALGLTVVFWLPIWCGAGLVGGDIYSYFFPQKVVYSEALRAGELPLWNDRAGFGYPLLAESQTGIFYPPNLVLYRLLDVHSAFHVSFLLHYFLAFVFASTVARVLGMNLLPSWLTALIYVYGWFPPRTCVEWAIIGGTWLPAALWCAERWLATRWWRFAIALSGVLAVQLLAGHFQIAWFTLLLLAAYVPARVWWFGARESEAGRRDEVETSRQAVPHSWRATLVCLGAIVCGFGLAAVQLLPTYELKGRSQRATIGKEHELDFGSIPLWYWTQLVRPSHWYSPLTDREAAFRERPPLGHARTNSTEAHLYWGLAPLLLVLVGVVQAWRTRHRAAGFWLVIVLLSGLYTSGWFVPVAGHLPGFGYFQGPGRYGLLTTWGSAVLAGFVVDRFLRGSVASRFVAWTMLAGAFWSLSVSYFLEDDIAALMTQVPIRNPLSLTVATAAGDGPLMSLLQVGLVVVVVLVAGGVLWWLSERPAEIDARVGLIGLMLLATTLEFWTISRLVTFTQMVESPPLPSLEESPVRKILLATAKTRPTLRLYAPGPNLPSMLGVSSVPIYLTFGPAEYVDPAFRLPDAGGAAVVPATGEQLDWLVHRGVTHVLCFEPPPLAHAKTTRGELKLVWHGDDPFLNRAWGRAGQPLYLYELANARGRLQWQSSSGQAHEPGSWKVTAFASYANRVECYVEVPEAGVLKLADLDDPGWTVLVNGQRAAALRVDGQFRGVRLEAGAHRVVWQYRPRSVWIGASLSVSTWLLLAAVAHVRFWHPQRLAWLDDACSAELGAMSKSG